MEILKNGSKGEQVKILQKLLDITADGIFGKNTEAKVKSFQQSKGLVADGIVGQKTWEALGITCASQVTNKIKILIDNGHGSDTSGKCSPDKRLLEYKWSREVAQMIVNKLKSEGYDAERIVTEENDISLKERCRRVNTICSQVGKENCILISVHINAANGTGWSNATGWSGWVAPNASNNSKKLAKIIYEEAATRGLEGNRSVPSGKYWTGNFAIVRDTNCTSVLTENLFMTNKKEVDFLLSDEGKQTITDLHVAGLKKYIEEL